MKETMHFIVMKLRMCLLNFPIFMIFHLVHWIILATICCCCTCSLYLAFVVVDIDSCIVFGKFLVIHVEIPRIEKIGVIWSHLCIVLHITEDRSSYKVRIPVHSLDALFRLRWTSPNSIVYTLGLADQNGGVNQLRRNICSVPHMRSHVRYVFKSYQN